MKRHKMTIDITLEMPDDCSVVEARKRVKALLSGCRTTSTIWLTKFSSPRPWSAKERTCSDVSIEGDE